MSLALVVGCGDDSSADSGLTFTTTLDTSAGDDAPDDDGSTSGSADDTMTASMSASADETTTSGEDSTTLVPDSTGSETSTTGDPSCLEVDVPDINGLDENDDGIDGVVCRAIFVNGAIGSDLNDGTATDTPVATIQHAIDVAQQSNPPRMVLVAEGNYTETLNLNSGVSVYGGYDGTDWSRNVGANLTEITATEERAIIGQNLDAEVEVDGFTIHAMDFVDESATSYGVWIRDTPDGIFTLDYCVVDAGTGGSGADGEDGANGEDGGNGENAGGNGTNSQVGVPGMGGTSSCNATGGNGGSGQSCPGEGGDDGSAGGDPTAVGTGGGAGASECEGNTCNDEGGAGTPGLGGHAGVNGTGGDTASDNEGVFGGDGIWTAPGGAIAVRGDHGSGGGGGGAGGYDVDSGILCTFADGEGIGGGGGGGGAGGCGGLAGETGGAGGGSFAIVVVNSSIAVTNTDLFLANGGAGGSGGNGGNGGVPGGAGSGHDGYNDGGEAGDGREGGVGAGGGGGGGASGGCGGASVGIATVGDAEAAINNVSFNEGVGGVGGPGGEGGIRADGLGLQAPAGEDGCDGFRADQYAY
jgi:hypothetical protein